MLTEGEPATCFFVLLDGTISLGRHISGQRVEVNRTEYRGSYFGATQAYLEAQGYPPNVREISEGCGLRSTSSVSHQLQRLESLGRIKRTSGVARGIVVLDQGEAS